MDGWGRKQATGSQIEDLRRRVSALEATDERVLRFREFLSDRVLHRFITARNGDTNAALKMLVNHLIWRESYGIDTILDEDLSDLNLSKVFSWCGFDRDGRPCLVYRVREHIKPDSKKGKPTAEEEVRFFCQLLEQGFRDFAPAHKFCLIVDCRDAGSNVWDEKLFDVAMPILEDNFPETQHSTYIIPRSRAVKTAWEAISSFMDPGTADKVRLVSDFEDPLLLETYTPDTLKAIMTLDPSRATSQLTLGVTSPTPSCAPAPSPSPVGPSPTTSCAPAPSPSPVGPSPTPSCAPAPSPFPVGPSPTSSCAPAPSPSPVGPSPTPSCAPAPSPSPVGPSPTPSCAPAPSPSPVGPSPTPSCAPAPSPSPVGPSPTPSCAPALSPSPCSGYPPHSPGEASDEESISVHSGDNDSELANSDSEWKEKTGYLYKRRDMLRGRFAHRQRFAILRFPTTATMMSARCGDGAKRAPPAPTLTLLKNDQAGAGKVVSLQGAEVTLGTAMAGDLFPFVVSFPPLAPSPPPSPARRRRGGADDKPRGKWRNMGVVDSPLQSADEVPARRSSSGTGSPRRLFADGARKTLHLACNTHEKTLEWARWIADAAAIHKATLKAASNEERGGEGGMGAHVATSALGSSPLLDVPAAVEDCWPRRTGADGVARGASGTGAKAQRGGGEKVSSAGARRFLHVLNPFRRCTAAGCLAHGIAPGGPSQSSPSSLYTPSPAVRAGVCRGPGLGDGGESLLTMRDTEISRLRRSYARSEVSRWEMKRCLDALAVQLRDSEARTGALLADREAVRLELSAKEAELDRQKSFTEDIRAKAGVRLADREAVRLELSAKEAELDYQKAFTEGIRAKALVEARSKRTLVSSVKLENQALQMALERVCLELQEEREFIKRYRQETKAEAASAHSESYLHPPASQISCRVAPPRHSVDASPAPLSRAGTRTGLASTPGRPLLKGMEGELNGKSCPPCILNMDQTWVGAIRPPLQVLDHLLDGLEDVLALVGPWDEQGVLTSEAFVAWSSWTGELQRVPALESVDLPGEKRFTEGCLKLLRSHAAMVLGKKPDQLTGEDESRMAYAIGDGVYTILRLSAHLGALTAGLPTE